MTTLTVRRSVGDAILNAANEIGFRRPSGIMQSLPNGGPTVDITYDPDLTPEEQATWDTLAQLATGATLITPAELDTIRPSMVALRDLRQMGRAAFMALTAAERDRLSYDAHVATTMILLAILRD